MSTDIGEWYQGIPKVTKFLFTSSFMLTVAANFNVLSHRNLIFHWPSIYNGFEFWRLATCFFDFGKLGFPFLINLYFLYNYSIRLETGIFSF